MTTKLQNKEVWVVQLHINNFGNEIVLGYVDCFDGKADLDDDGEDICFVKDDDELILENYQEAYMFEKKKHAESVIRVLENDYYIFSKDNNDNLRIRARAIKVNI